MAKIISKTTHFLVCECNHKTPMDRKIIGENRVICHGCNKVYDVRGNKVKFIGFECPDCAEPADRLYEYEHDHYCRKCLRSRREIMEEEVQQHESSVRGGRAELRAFDEMFPFCKRD